ncbi:sn-glycerol-3-phosphate transport system permease protein UgpE [Limnohabitans sp. MORI2]|jgi:alpha-1,4-digalacturonate transport system permease protein|uniref:carbohydrate ABC transporter permease n=1 Tax=Limnohabitans sp. MORI2 TaxID=1751150 RepID=UPI002376D32E|nr:carbohydrate ABC transporter permease [Limnohabitans sp. MORI2]BDU58645.1 sn-glycerol-3-phosphate transport system permease protein UgpE [Limnohabitans sp. MORI2]
MKILEFLLRTRGRRKLHWTDTLSYAYLLLGLVTMFAPVLWLVLSSFKSEAAIAQFPPTLLPYAQKTVEVSGYNHPLPLFNVNLDDGTSKTLAQASRMGISAMMVDPDSPEQRIQVNIKQRQPVNEIKWAWNNYTDLFRKFAFGTYLWNSVFITLVATLLTLLFNSMAAFALSKYRFTGQKVVFLLIIATLMIPPTIILVPVFLVINQIGLLNSLWGVILPAVATPTGVFLLRQYMLTIPDELIEAARMDHASEWRIYWRIILPLSAPALAVLAIFSVMWRWNDFLLPLIVLSQNEHFTLQLALNSFQGELNTQWHYLLAMTVITLLPVTLVFAFLQRHITTGIASAGVK